MIRGSDISVIVPTIPGREALLTRALHSISVQQVQPARIIVQLDKERLGAWATRNAALEHVETDWVLFCDDDDTMLPNHVKVLVRGANQSKADLIFTYPEWVGISDPLACCYNGKLVAGPINVPFGPQQQDHLDARRGKYCAYCSFERGNFIPCAWLCRTSLLKQVGGFPAPYSMGEFGSSECEDFECLLALLDIGAKFHHVCGVRTWMYHVHGSNLGGRGLDRMAELDGN